MSDNELKRLKEVVARACGTTVDKMDARTRLAAPALARQVAMYYVVKSGKTLEATGEIFKRHYTNVVYAKNKVADMRDVDPWVQGVMNEVEREMPQLVEEVARG
jgi:chromosomal replication initiation ATPase DnaA